MSFGVLDMTQPTAPSAPLFHASAVKIKRARKHWAELDAMAKQHAASNPVTHKRLDGEHGPGFHTQFRGVSEDFGAVVGDLMHNLRAALDLMACDLARANGRSVNNVYFPFCDGVGELDEMIKRRHFQRTGSAAVALLKSLKPYRGGNDALRAIHDLDIQDKHQELIPAAMNFSGPVFRVAGWEGKKALLEVVPETLERSDIELVFPHGSALAGKQIVPTLHELIELTAGILEAFKALCEVPGVAVNSTGAHPAQPLASVVQRSSS